MIPLSMRLLPLAVSLKRPSRLLISCPTISLASASISSSMRDSTTSTAQKTTSFTGISPVFVVLSVHGRASKNCLTMSATILSTMTTSLLTSMRLMRTCSVDCLLLRSSSTAMTISGTCRTSCRISVTNSLPLYTVVAV